MPDDRATTMTTTEWARAHGRGFRYRALLDNYEPPRDMTSGQGWFYDLGADDPRGSGIVLENVRDMRDARKAVYLIDDGRTIRVYYVAGWHPEGDHLILHPMPTNYNEDGTRKVRADDGRPVSFDSWQLGPRRAFHLKVVGP
jgi:hypothetical protein